MIVLKNWLKKSAMKGLRFSLGVALVSLCIPTALAATKSIAPIPMVLIANLPDESQVSGALIKAKTIYVFGNQQTAPNVHGYIKAIGESGSPLWSLPLESGINDIATAATFDARGHLWVVGTSGPIGENAQTTVSQAVSVLNPDSVVLDPFTPIRADLTNLILWEIAQNGALVSTFRTELARSVIAQGITATADGFAVVGLVASTFGSAGFLQHVDSQGNFGVLHVIGAKDTEFSSVVKTSSGFLLSGSSTEKLSGKPLLGVRDALAVSVTSTGKILSVLRSTNSATVRTWRSSTPAFFLGGDALISGKNSAVVTKFSAKMAPTWTARFSSPGPAFVVDAPLTRFGVFASDAPIVGVGSWKPTRASVLALGFDAKGQLQRAYSAKALSAPIAIGYTTSLGLVVVGKTGEKGVSIFHALTR